MVRNCSICKIDQGMITDVSFHRIPNNPEIKTKWVMSIGQELSNYNSVCSRHFEEKDFYYKVYGGDIKRFLKSTAVPSCLLTQRKSSLPVTIENLYTPNSNNSNNCSNSVSNKNDNCAQASTSHENERADIVIEDNVPYISDNSNTSLDLQYADNIQKEKTSKRKLNKPFESEKKKLRYIGDLSREDFTSNNAWSVVKRHATNCRKDKISLTTKIKRATKKIESLQSILNNLRKKGLLCDEVCNTYI